MSDLARGIPILLGLCRGKIMGMPKAGSDPDTTTPTGGRIHRNGWALSPFCPGAFRRSYWVLSAEICNDCRFRLKAATVSDAKAASVPIASRPAFRFDGGHHSDMKPATLPL
ncbi:hypothetical protein [Azospirillum sp. INR13]|uniref:hypothetical protein n=1 Tax=Azospirillum sp. INR13 TaxID=2596919 RepID=UPI0018927E6E|nr:hypothetical protein [Azospirillum sp. INR13]